MSRGGRKVQHTHGTCGTCSAVHPIIGPSATTTTRGKLVEHTRPIVRASLTGFADGRVCKEQRIITQRCEGSYTFPKEKTDAARARRHTKKLAEIEAARGDASVLVDAISAGRVRETGLDFAHYVSLAMAKYRIEHPDKRPIDPIVIYQKPANAEFRAKSHRWRTKQVYCLICGELLAARVEAANAIHYLHGQRCALLYLAGLRDAVKPGTKLLAPANNDHGPLFNGAGEVEAM